MSVNHEIRAPRVRLISDSGEQLGVVTTPEAMAKAREASLDLVMVVATSDPPVCKIMDFGKFRYEQTKREREGKKSQHQIKVKEVKITPNISEHDLEIKMKQARAFLEKGNKVKVSCFFRGREIAHADVGFRLMESVVKLLEDLSMVEAAAKLFGKSLTTVLAPLKKKKS